MKIAVSRKPNSVHLRALRRFGVTTIPLAPALLPGSSDLPGDLDGPSNQRSSAGRLPIWPCSVRGFACHPCYHERGALLPHLFTLTSRLTPEGRVEGRYIFCATFLQVTLTGRYPAHCPAEFGLSSLRLAPSGESNGDHLAHCGGSVSFAELLIDEC